MNNIIKTNQINKFSVIWLFLLLFLCALSNFPNLPLRTHEIAYFLALNGCDHCGLGLKVNSIILTPIYKLISPILIDMRYYIIFQKISFIIQFTIIFFLLINLNKKNEGYFNPVICFLCLILFFNFSDNQFSKIPAALGIGNGFLNFVLSARTVFTLAVFIGFFLLIKNKLILSGFFFLIAGMAHPTNFIVIILLSFIYIAFEYLFLKTKNTKTNYYVFIILLLIGISPSIYKYFTLSDYLNEFVSTDIEIKNYIISMYRDEIDDFSALYQLTSDVNWVTMLKIIFIIFPSTWYLKNYKSNLLNSNLLKLTPMIYASLFLFFAIAFIEYLYFKFGIGIFIIEKNISTQFGLRILQYTGIISLFFWIEFAKFILNEISKINLLVRYKINFSQIAMLLSLITVSVYSIFVLKPENIKSFIKFSHYDSSKTDLSLVSKSVVYDAMLDSGFKYKILNKNFKNQCTTSNMKVNYTLPNYIYNNDFSTLFKKHDILSAQNKEFVENYNQLKTRIKITNKILKKIPKNNGLIIPPYFYCFREFLMNYDIWFQEHDDGNFMMGSKIIFEKFFSRMQSIGIDYLKLPTQNSKMNYSEMRKKWLSLKDKDFLKILKINNNFKYIITESNHNLNFQKIFTDKFWSIYLIK